MSLLHNSLVIALLTAAGFIVAYFTYGRFLARKILGLDPHRATPAHAKHDGVDHVPTHPAVLFGHHFASIAGLGPIVGPAIALVWGWGPALLWIVFGSIFMGAVHDLTTLYASLRHEGRGLGELTDEVIGARARILFLLIIFFLLALAMGVFALFMAELFTDLCPQAVVPTFSLILIAVVIGLLVYRWKWRLGRVTLLGLALMFSGLLAGMQWPGTLYRTFVTDEAAAAAIARARAGESPAAEAMLLPNAAADYFDEQSTTDPTVAAFGATIRRAGEQSKDWWTCSLLLYAFLASVLPVWLLLQPRDYINSYQLYIGLAALLAGLMVWHRPIDVPPFAAQPGAGGPVVPFLFITVACGAISGFHSLVSSGTTVRQLRSEAHARPIGYGAMLTEGFLAVLVVLACVAGLSSAKFQKFYSAQEVKGLGAFLEGAGVVISKPLLWISGTFDAVPAKIEGFCTSFIAVVVVSFAMTTLDSATRLLRFNVEALGDVLHLSPLRNRYLASLVAVASIGFFAFIKIDGKAAGKTLWQLFGTTNQLLAALGLLVVSVMLYKMKKPIVYTLVPMILMIVTVWWAMVYKLREFFKKGVIEGDRGSQALFVLGGVLLVLAVWMVVEAAFAFRRYQMRRTTVAVA